jgi:hypothetical protein
MAQPVIPPIRPPNGPPFPKGGGGSTPTAGTRSSGFVNIPVSNGGVFAQGQIALYPCFNINTQQVEFHAFDPTQGYNDPLASSEYFWRYEKIQGMEGSSGGYRQPTIRRLIVTYRDLGQVTTTWTITGSNDLGKVVSNSVSVGWGNKVPTGRLMTTAINIVLTCMMPQISVFRDKNAGPLSIAQMFPVGTIEETKL